MKRRIFAATLCALMLLLCITSGAISPQPVITESFAELAGEETGTDVSDLIPGQSQNQNTPFESGDGTQASPYIISTAAHLVNASQLISRGNANTFFELKNDIDLAGIEWTPIGSTLRPYSGTFDGKGFCIENFKITASHEYTGLFGYAKNATIKNLEINNFVIDVENATLPTGSKNLYVGLVAGQIFGENTTSTTVGISNVYAQGSIDITATSISIRCGGIAGDATSNKISVKIENSYSDAQISISSAKKSVYAGGIAGNVYVNKESDVHINNCYSLGTYTAGGSVNTYGGGIVGYMSSFGGEWSEWHDENQAQLSDDTDYVISNSFTASDVTVEGKSTTGAGRIYGDKNEYCDIKNCAFLETQTVTKNSSSITASQSAQSATKDNLSSQTYLEENLSFDFDIWTAVENDYPVLYPEITAPAVTYGDINGDKDVSIKDAIMLSQYLADTISLTDEQKAAANVYKSDDEDGSDNINIKDAILLSQFLADMDVELGK